MDDNKIDSLTVDIGFDSSGFKRGQKEIDEGIEKIEKGADRAAESVDGLGDSAREAGAEVEGFGGKNKGAAENVKELGDAADDASENVGNLSGSADEASESVDGLGEISEEAAEKIRELEEELSHLSASSEDSSEKVSQLETAISKLKKSSRRSGEEFSAHFKQMTSAARGLANELLGIAALSGGSFALGKSAQNSISDQADTGRTSAMIGMKPRDLKGWENTSEAFGGTAQEVDGFLQKIADIPTDNILRGVGIPEWLRALNIDLSDGHGGRKDTNEAAIEILDKLNRMPADFRSNIIRNDLGGGQGMNALSSLGGDSLRSELQKGADRSGITEESVQRTQELQKSATEAIQEMKGVWNEFISDNAPRLTEAIKEISREFSRFTHEISKGMKDFQKFRKESGGDTDAIGSAANYIAIKGLSIVTGGDEKKAAEYNKWLNEHASDMKQSKGGLLYDPRELPDHPDDPLEKLWPWERVQVWARQRRREELRKNGQSTDTQGLKETEASDDELWRKNQEAIDWRNKRIDEIERRGFQAVYPDHIPGESVEDMKQRMSSPAPAAPAQKSQGKLPPALAEMQSRLAELEKEHGLPEGWMTKIAMKESSGNPYAVSYDKNGRPVARGMYQFTPGTAADWHLADPFNKYDAARASAQFYASEMKKHGGDMDKAMAAYHSGPAFVKYASEYANEHGGDWRDALGPNGAKYIEHPYKESAPIRDYVNERIGKKPKRRDQNAQQLADAPTAGDVGTDQAYSVKPMYQLGPHLSPGVQNAWNSQDNRSTTSNSTRIDQINVNMTGGNAQDVSNNIGSVIQRHPFLNGANYA